MISFRLHVRNSKSLLLIFFSMRWYFLRQSDSTPRYAGCSSATKDAHLQAYEKPCSSVGKSRQRQCWCGLHALHVLGAWTLAEVEASACLQGASAWCSTVLTRGWHASLEGPLDLRDVLERWKDVCTLLL